MDIETKKKLIKRAMLQAEKAIKKWDSPFWAILADWEWNIIAASHNTSNSDKDPTAHAEIDVIRKTCKKLSTKDLSNLYLISNAESCPMCMTAAIKAKIKNFIFGAPIESDSDPYLTVFDIAKHSKNSLHIETWILKDECLEQITFARNNKKE